MIIRSANLETVCGITSTLPANSQPEVAFAGKSNVGKSSLINTLIQRKNYARTSAQPGKTQTINYYHINDEFYCVDLPGYGYAKTAATEKEKWGKMIEKYLHTSGQLKNVFLLVDIRHEPSDNDCQMFDWIIANGFRPIVVATKKDKLGKQEALRQLAVIRKKLKMEEEDILIPFSAESREGREEILSLIEKII